MAVVSTEIKGETAVVRIDNPPVNALSHAVRAGLLEAAERLDSEAGIRAVILICAGRTFIAGADIREFGKPLEDPQLPQVIARIEAASIPWIAAIHGTALGGGFETALGCHYRLAAPTAKVGLPEVNLGLIPGAGGTVRLPRLVAMDEAIAMVSGGRPVSAVKAKAMGLVDELAGEGEELEAFALGFAARIAGRPLPVAVSRRPIVSETDDAFWTRALDEAKRKARGQLSPVAAVEALRDSASLPAVEAMKAERWRFTKLRESDQSKALRHIFFAERQTAKVPEIDGVEPLAVETVGVIGGGTMGAGIAAATLLAGLPVTVIERDEPSLDASLARVRALLGASRKRGIIDEARGQALLSSLHGGTDYQALSNADLVIEAVFEDMDIKREVFARLDEATRPDTVLATNTSYMDVNRIAGNVADPSRVIGLHFFSPAHIMKLVEVIRPDRASERALATGFAFARRLKKVPVLSGVCEGFIGNRILTAYRRQCDAMLEEGALPQEIDAAMKAFGLPMGVYAMQDMAGLDISWAMRKRLAATRDPAERYVRIADRLCELGRFGQKAGAGWYLYEEGSREPKVDPLVERIIVEESAAKNIKRRSFGREEVQTRIVDAMTAEAGAILDEGIALRPGDIDVVMVLGYGFPRWRGGPMFMAGEGRAD